MNSTSQILDQALSKTIDLELAIPNLSPTLFLKASNITLLDAKRIAYKQLKSAFLAQKICHGHGFLDALEEAQEITLAAAGLNYQDIDQEPEFWHSKLMEDELNWLFDTLKQRIEMQKPLPYLTKRSYLQGLEFYIDERALIPRSFIAEILQNRGLDKFLENAFEEKSIIVDENMKADINSSFKILELCTGSGCLAILAAEIFEEATIQAIDISEDALKVAAINHEKYQFLDPDLANRVNFYKSDLYNNIEDLNRFDIIITNPPYVCQASMNKLPQEYRYEPALALAGGEDGMNLIQKIIEKASLYLKPSGFLVIEIGNEYAHMIALFKRLGIKKATWLEVSAGSTQVCLIQAVDLIKFN